MSAYGEAIRDAAARLQTAGAPDPLRDAEILMRWAAGLTPEQLSVSRGDAAPAEALAVAPVVARAAPQARAACGPSSTAAARGT